MIFNKQIFAIACSLTALIACNSQPKETLPPPRPEKIDPNPSSAYLSPEESMKTMHLPDGYHLELVASEPVIQEPVAIVWDGNGRMYVAEMRSYMQDIDGTGEQLPICRITRLEDTDGDGKMDKHSVYIDSLVLPRMMLALDDRLLVNETYSFNIHAYRDKNDDGVADEKLLVFQNDKRDDANLEHQKSGLIWNIDNWIYVTYNPVRYRFKNDQLVADSMVSPPGGQWGLANDNYGRLFFSSAGGENPALNFQENPVYGQLDMDDQLVGDFNEVWPIIGTPDVQGGQERLRPDSTLNHFTASCGQAVFRGDQLPQSLVGDLFICEPVGRLIRRAKMSYRNGQAYLTNAYEKREFLASSDMNFRPVNLVTGPDGCLYIVDMYHGIIQESAWTKPDSYIHPQIKRKQLDLNKNRGRIYRVVHDDFKPGKRPQLLQASPEELVRYLSHPNGWWRDNAQKLLVLKQDKKVIPALEKLALGEKTFLEKLAFWKSDSPSVGRLHALWTLEGLESVGEDFLIRMLADKDPEIRKAAIRISESFLQQGNKVVLEKIGSLANDVDAAVRIQLALSLRFSRDPAAIQLLKQLQAENAGKDLLVKVAGRSLDAGDPAKEALRTITSGMDSEDRDLIFQGAMNFQQLCATCHGMDGNGVPAKLAPPLVGSPRVNGDPQLLINILLHGLMGPVDNARYPDVMPAQQQQSDEYIASVLSYIRNGFGKKGGMVFPDQVKAVRERTLERKEAWTLDELNAWQQKNNQKP